MKAGNQPHRKPPARSGAFFRWSGHLLCVAGILALSYCAYVLFAAELYQSYQSRRFDEALKSAKAQAAGSEVPPPSVLPLTPEATLTPAASRSAPVHGDVLLGRIQISRLGLAAMIMEGIDNKTLRRAVGHIPGTALPGVPLGNVGIAGHRDTFFRGLQHVRKQDEITLTTLQGSYRYRVDSILVVEPREIWVLRDTGEATLTLVTCYPFDMVGPAPQRFLVRARKIPDEPKAAPSEK